MLDNHSLHFYFEEIRVRNLYCTSTWELNAKDRSSTGRLLIEEDDTVVPPQKITTMLTRATDQNQAGRQQDTRPTSRQDRSLSRRGEWELETQIDGIVSL